MKVEKMISIVDTMVIESEQGEKFMLEIDYPLIHEDERYILAKAPEYCLFEVVDLQHIVSMDSAKVFAVNFFFPRKYKFPFWQNRKFRIVGLTYNTKDEGYRLSTKFSIANGDKRQDMVSLIFTNPDDAASV
jgi:hypothetical protein